MNRKRILIGLAALLVLIQLIRIDKTNPPVDPKIDFATAVRPPAEVLAVIKDACYDCHSHEVKYPWYSNVAPVSWWLKHHVNEALEHFNFSTLGILKPDDLKWALGSAAEEIREKEMPLKSYTLMHPEARLSDEQGALLATWLDTFVPPSTGYGETEEGKD
ncbi:MAG: heme-binding domain-containing protein [Saprospiraceae bacterium]|nr:heme-binding domain-containing protein [Saprospiraceae bacterium]